MRTHLLKNLSISGEEKLTQIREFDFHRLSLVDEIFLHCEENDSLTKNYHFEFRALYRDQNNENYRVAFRLTKIRFARLPPLTPTFFLTEVEVEDVAEHQIEGVRYRIKSYGMTEFEILAQDIEVVSCEPIK